MREPYYRYKLNKFVKMCRLFLTATIFIISNLLYAQSPTFQWAKNIGGYHGYSTGTGVVVDSSGNVFTTGYFEGRVDFDPGIGTYYLTSGGFNDIFISKSDASGNFLWAKQFGGNLNDQSKSIALSASGNICITGFFSGAADFDPGTALYNLTSSGDEDIFISKLDPSGNLLWAYPFGYLWDDIANSVAIDVSGNVYTTGSFAGTVDFDPGSGNFNLTTGGNTVNTFILKLSPVGNFAFALQFSGSVASGNSITIDPSGNICTAGYFINTIDFDPGAGVYNLTAPGGLLDVFISKLTTNGNFIWAKQLGGAQSDNVSSVKSDAGGNIYTVGTFMGTADFDPGPAVSNLTSGGAIDVYLSKLDASGNYIWAGKVGGTTNSERGNSISLDVAGNIYSIGTFGGTVDFDPGPSTYNLTSTTNYGVFVLKLSPTGNFAWAKVISGTDDISGNSVANDAIGSVYITGTFRETCDFDPGIGVYDLVALGGNFLFTSKLNTSGNFEWAKSAGAGASTFSKAMTTDVFGNVYTTGYFFGKVDFDPGPGVVTLSTFTSDHEGDIFVTKSNSSGNLIWAKKMGGISHDYANAIAVDSSGNVYTAGSFKATADFNPGAGVFNLTSSTSYYNTFLSKLNASGNFIWAKKLSFNAFEEINSIFLDSSGNLYTACSFLSGTNSYQININKFNSSGNLSWSKIYGGPSIDQANAIATDVTGNIYFTGYFEGNADFDPGPGVYNMTAGGRDVFVCKIDVSGNFVWAKQMGGTAYEESSAIALDDYGNVHITGHFFQTADFDPGPGTFNMTSSAGQPDIFVSKLDSAGNFIWAKQFEGISTEMARSIVVDNPGNVYTAGNFYGTTDFDPGPGSFNLISAGYSDIFISKLDAMGNFVWAQQIGSTTAELVTSIALDGSANIYTCGNFYETVDFDPTPGTSNLTAHGSPDLFMHKISQCILPPALITPTGPTTFCLGGSVTLNANTGAGLTYQWLKNGISISGAVSSSYVATTKGNYSAFISNSVLCSETSNTINVDVPCIPIDPNQDRISQSTAVSSKEIKVFPNPGTGIFVIEAPSGQLQIFDSIGRIVKSTYLHNNEMTLDLSDIADGIYTLKLKTEKYLFIQKVILNR